MQERFFTDTLEQLYDHSPASRMNGSDRFVVFSDLHLGNGGDGDDFLRNAGLCSQVLRHYYLDRGFVLILNGDIEDLHKFSLKKIENRWGSMYELFADFRRKTDLFKIVGNHDVALVSRKARRTREQPLRSLRLNFGDNTIFIFHGHQASLFYERFNYVDGFFLRYFAQPLGIKNYSVAYDSAKRFKVEKRVYGFSARKKILSIIGHTHRPLFESLSKVDSIKFRIEHLCRLFTDSEDGVREKIEQDISFYRRELQRIYEKDRKDGTRSSLYNSNMVVPCLFNSGCTIGKRGITALEIANNSIALVCWFDGKKNAKHFSHNRQPLERLETSDYYRTVLKKDCLNYIFTRIRLLS